MDFNNPTVYTIGFGKKSAKQFFTLLRANNIGKVIDVRLNNVSQLAGFSKKNDLSFFLEELCNCRYEHRPNWAPTKDLLDRYKKKRVSWAEYEMEFIRIIQDRDILNTIKLDTIVNSCLLCSEPTPEQCHRRLLAEHIQLKFPDVRIVHL
jgi:Uncharacterized conserved protein